MLKIVWISIWPHSNWQFLLGPKISEHLGFGNCHEHHHRHVAYIIFHPNLNPVPQQVFFAIPAHTTTPAFKYVHLHLQLRVCDLSLLFSFLIVHRHKLLL